MGEREKEGRWDPSGMRELFILHNGPSAIVPADNEGSSLPKKESRVEGRWVNTRSREPLIYLPKIAKCPGDPIRERP